MPFIVPFLPAIAGGVGSLLGSKLSGGSGGVPNAKGLLADQTASIKQGRDLASGLQPQAQSLLSGATQSYSPVANYWSSLLGGNRTSAMSALQPEVSRINEGYNQNLQAAGNLMPRGGGRSALLSQAPYERTRDITNLLQTSRPQAAQGLLQTGQAQGNQSQGLYSLILNALGGSQSGTSSLLNYDLQDRDIQYRKGKELGGTLFDLLQKIPSMGKKKEAFSY